MALASISSLTRRWHLGGTLDAFKWRLICIAGAFWFVVSLATTNIGCSTPIHITPVSDEYSIYIADVMGH